MRVVAEPAYGTLSRERSDLAHKSIILAVVVIPLLAVVVAIWQVWERYISPRDLVLLVALYVPISLGVTAGFHRMLTHRSFRAHAAVRCIMLILGSMALEGSAVEWAANHLKHHALADKAGDPHSPLDGLAHAHLGWLFRKDQADPRVYGRFLLNDPIVSFVDRTFLVWVVLSLVVPFVVGGWTGLIWGGLVRIFLVHHVTWRPESQVVV
jgi:stearoyl-CoA desaturase (delta-9 desaturase)